MDRVERHLPGRGPVWLGTSWKMTKTLAEARTYAEELARTAVPVWFAF